MDIQNTNLSDPHMIALGVGILAFLWCAYAIAFLNPKREERP